jgi:hypothetical protein
MFCTFLFALANKSSLALVTEELSLVLQKESLQFCIVVSAALTPDECA